MTNNKYYAHSVDGQGQDAWQKLDEHLCNVAAIASDFTGEIGLPEIGALLGLIHDVGKYSSVFQEYIRNPNGKKGKVDHSTAGAQLLFNHLSGETPQSLLFAQILALCAASHHSGLIDCLSPDGDDIFSCRMSKSDELTHYAQVYANMEDGITRKTQQLLRCNGERALICKLKKMQTGGQSSTTIYLKWNLLTRFLLSCLIDADRIDSANKIRHAAPDWAKLVHTFEQSLAGFGGNDRNNIDAIRKTVSIRCLEIANGERGLYLLTVPTGGGKTLASLRFALHHALAHKCTRIIYVIPFTSIIDQNAKCARTFLKDENGTIVLEHHSNIAPESETESRQSMSENWDAPIIFTTNVQFLEAMFGSGTGATRRMHRLSNAVIIFDEVQTIPIKCVHLFNNAVNFLVESCNSTVVLMTATQPLLNTVDKQQGSLEIAKSHNIMEDVPQLFRALKRVDVCYKKEPAGWSKERIVQLAAKEAIEMKSVLIIVNTKSAAKEIYEACKGSIDAETHHLSTNMCPAHRMATLAHVKAALTHNQNLSSTRPMVCVSTSLIEAGVDVDFGCVIRYLAGLDSIAQAAGRCNRNGLRNAGHVYIIKPDHENMDFLPDIQLGKEKAERVLNEYMCEPAKFDNDIIGPKMIELYFQHYFHQQSRCMGYPVSKPYVQHEDTLISLLSSNNLAVEEYKRKSMTPPKIPLRQSFMTAAEAFRPIEDRTKGVIVPYDLTSRDLIKQFGSASIITPCMLRNAQRYSVNVYQNVINKLRNTGAIFEVRKNSDILVLMDSYYHPELGLTLVNEEKQLWLVE